MELDKTLANKSLTRYYSYKLLESLLKKEVSKEYYSKLDEIKLAISNVITESLDLFINKDLLEVYRKYPIPFYSANKIYIDLSSLGIISEDSSYYTEDKDSSVQVMPRFSISLKSGYPCVGFSSLILAKSELEKFPESKLELLKSLVSEWAHIEWQYRKNISDISNKLDSIKTIGRLYRVNEDWYCEYLKIFYPERLSALNIDSVERNLDNIKEFTDLINSSKIVLGL